MSILKDDAHPSWKLRIELVPRSLWGVNLRSKEHGLGEYGWQKLRTRLLDELGAHCVICESCERPHAHEIWKYEEGKGAGLALLVGVEIICARCHSIHHWGKTKQLVDEGKMDRSRLNDLIEHFCAVNNCTREEFERHSLWAFAEFQRRNKKKWRSDFGAYSADVQLAKADREVANIPDIKL